MRSHLASLRSLTRLAAAAVLGVAALAAGCGSHTAAREFGSLPATPEAPAPAPPVVVAEPAPAPKTAKPVDKAAAAQLAQSRKQAKHAAQARAVARTQLRKERAAAAKQHKLAAAREKHLKNQLAAAKLVATPAPSGSKHTVHTTSPQISASDVNDVSDSQRDARVAVVRFHQRLNDHDPAACDLLTTQYMAAHFGGDASTAPNRCRWEVAQLTVPFSVLIQDSGTEGTGIWVKMLSRIGDGETPQVMHLVRSGGAWLIDSAESAS